MDDLDGIDECPDLVIGEGEILWHCVLIVRELKAALLIAWEGSMVLPSI